jgi:hypothetical protein
MSVRDVQPKFAPATGRPAEAGKGDEHDERDKGGGSTRQSWWRRNALVLVCLACFLAFLGAQSVTGWRVYNDGNEDHGQETVTFPSYLTSGHFVEGTLENWESEFLQMAAFVLLTVYLVEKGSAESKKTSADEDIDAHRDDPDAPWPVRRGGAWLKLYENSLFLAFLVLFLLAMAGHALGGAREYNEEQESHGHPPVTTVEFVATSDYWYQSFQNWQSEFLAVASISLLSIFLRQKGSSQSKAVYAPDGETGG